jgi:hypothetical protein
MSEELALAIKRAGLEITQIKTCGGNKFFFPNTSKKITEKERERE